MKGYDELLEQLEEEENSFLESQGMDFDRYNEFAANYVPPVTDDQPDSLEPDIPDSEFDGTDKSDEQNDSETPFEPEVPQFDWAKIPKELWPQIQQLTGAQPPSQW